MLGQTATNKPADMLCGAKLYATGEGGYVITYDKKVKEKEAYEGYRYAGEKIEIFKSGDKALERLDEIVSSSNYEGGRDFDISFESED